MRLVHRNVPNLWRWPCFSDCGCGNLEAPCLIACERLELILARVAAYVAPAPRDALPSSPLHEDPLDLNNNIADISQFRNPTVEAWHEEIAGVGDAASMNLVRLGASLQRKLSLTVTTPLPPAEQDVIAELSEDMWLHYCRRRDLIFRSFQAAQRSGVQDVDCTTAGATDNFPGFGGSGAKKSTLEPRLHLTIMGCGPQPVIVVHGMLSTSRFFSDGLVDLLPAAFLSRVCTFYIPDLMGYGRSSGILANENYSIAEQAARIYCDVIVAEQLEGYHIIGHSYGGAVAVALAALNPQRLFTLTLLSPAYFESVETGFLVTQQAPIPAPWVSALPHLGRHIIVALGFLIHALPTICSIVPSTTLAETALRDLITTEPSATLGTIATLLYDRIDGWLAILEKNQIRILLLQADHDVVVPPEQGRKMALKYPNVVYRELPGMGHLFPQSHAEIIAQILQQEILRWTARNFRTLDDWIIS